MMSGAKKMVPKRRFKEFLNAGDWEQRKLSEVVTINPKTELPDEFKYVDLESVVGTNLLGFQVIKKENAPSRAQRLASYGDVFYQTVRPYQRNNYLFENIDKDMVFSTGYAQLRSKLDSYFLLTLVQNDNFVKVVLDNCTGTSYPAINGSELGKITVQIPSSEVEANQIGKVFRGIDKSITLHQRKLDKLQATKKALLQEMFPEEGQDKPKRRFKGFTDAWEQRKLGDFTNQINTFVNPEDAKLPLWSLTAEAGLIEKSDRYERDFLVKKKDQFKRIETNTLVYNPMNITIGSIDIYTGLYPIAVSGYYVSIVYDKNIDTDFLKEVLLLPSSLKMYKNYATGSLIERQRVQYPTFSKLQLLLPNLDEQKAIGQFFKSLNLDITLHQRKLDKLKNLKQAYLNEMFV